ncbi:hypothetical protein F2P81_009386 [Scophthalmus maximus]|uniref:Junction-mediating and-regulatory protein-like n=1 Tax=Scophthalmus maximus TaxID=52904 RepID=A0A6A4T9S5_SCOMX|nr:hypothetical protein F2P81_009386 [Scophthalmus maximus]
MSFTMEDNLESGWVSVRPRVFDEKERHKFAFIVAWNDIEGRFAVTCHNRTAQRRATFLDPLLDCSAGSGAPGAPLAAEKHARGPGATASDGARQAARARPRSVPEGKPAARAGGGDGTAAKVAGSQTSECVSRASGSWDVVTDIEILGPADAPPSPGEADPGDREDFSWAGLFSFQDLRAAHLQLCSVNSDLAPCLPALPQEPCGVWSALFGAPAAARRDTGPLCRQLQVYLGHALDACGWRILSRVLFSESDGAEEEYYESLGELRRKGHEDALDRAKRRMQEVLDKHKALDSMVELLQISLETQRLGPRRVEGLRKEDEEWQKKAHAAVLSIQDLTVRFFETTARAQKGKHRKGNFFKLTFPPYRILISDRLHARVISVNSPTLLQKNFNPKTISAMQKKLLIAV